MTNLHDIKALCERLEVAEVATDNFAFVMNADLHEVLRILRPIAEGKAVIALLQPTKQMLDAGETALENEQDSDRDSDAHGNSYSYTYFTNGVSGAALAIYRAMLAASQEKPNG